MNALARCFLRNSQPPANFAEIKLLEESQEDCSSFLVRKLVDGFIQYRGYLCRIWIGILLHKLHLGSLPFPSLTTALSAHHGCGNEHCLMMQPAAQKHVSGQCICLFSQCDKHNLGYVLGQVPVTAHQPDRCGVNKVDVAG